MEFIEKNILQQYPNLTENELIVLSNLLKLGLGNIDDIVKGISLNKKIVSYTLNKLIKKGLIKYYLNGNEKQFEVIRKLQECIKKPF